MSIPVVIRVAHKPGLLGGATQDHKAQVKGNP
jgi:hypothetical protein